MSPIRFTRIRRYRRLLVAAALAVGLVGASAAVATPASARAAGSLTVDVAVQAGLVDAPLQGRLLFLVGARGTDPKDDYVGVDGDVKIFGMNVEGLTPSSPVTMSGGGADQSDTGVYGYPYVSLDDLPAGDYTARAVFVRYDTMTRSDGSTVDLYTPCGDGGAPINGPGNAYSDLIDFTVGADALHLSTTLNQLNPTPTDSPEIGGCEQGNYYDTDTVKFVKIRSAVLSDFWGRDMYVGANVRLPPGYDPARAEGYPVIYNQSHWPGYNTAYWNNSGDPRFIFVTIRQESAYYDDAYSVNSANLGPWGDAISDELVPEIDRRFHTIAAPYGRLQDGGSTGGWTSLASTLFRPDVYGATWSYYPDSLDFHRHQAVNLYEDENAYYANGDPIGSWRADGVVTVTMPDENHYELALGTAGRSFDQWDVWNAVFSPQGYNGAPLDPWDKIDGTIDHDTTAMWAEQRDLTAYLKANWSSEKNLGVALRDRIHVSVGSLDNYYLNGGVEYFKNAVQELGGSDWAEVNIVPDRQHEGYYNYLSLGEQLDLMWTWVQDHAPTGATPLSAAAIAPTTAGNGFAEVLAWGGRQAAIDRQETPTVDRTTADVGDVVTADFGAWDPAMRLTGQWSVDGVPVGAAVDLGTPSLASVTAARSTYTVAAADAGKQVTFAVTGAKRAYTTETRTTAAVAVAEPTVPGGPVGPVPPTATTPPATGSSSSSADPAASATGDLAVTGRSGPALWVPVAAGGLVVIGAAFAMLAFLRRRRVAPNDELEG